MTTPTGTIDLGELAPGPLSELDAPWPVLVRLRRWHTPRRTGRLAGLAAVTVLVLLTATAAAASPRPLFTPQLTLPAVVSVELDQQNLYVVEAPAPGQTRVVAYRLADWTVRWERPLAESSFTGLFGWEGVLLSTDNGGISSDTVALDPGTGRKLWDWSGDQTETLAGGRFLVTDLEWADLSETEQPPPHQLTARDPATGRPLWTVPVPGGFYATEYDLDSRYLVTYGGGGELVSYDLATGDRLAGTTTPNLDLPEVQVQVVGSLVLLRDGSRSPSELVAYDARTLAALWTIPDPAALGYLEPVACGDLLCLIGERQPLRAVDPASGEPVWSADWLPVSRDEFVWVTELAGAGAGLEGLLLARSSSASWLIDGRTGELILDLRDWQLSPSRRWAPGAADAPPLLFQLGTDRTVVGRLAPDLSGIRPLGAIDATQPWLCGGGAGFVYCATEPDADERVQELTVWRHRPT